MPPKASLLALCFAVSVVTASAQRYEDVCAKQRALYPADWNDVSRETPLFACNARGAVLQVRVGATDDAGRTPLSVAPRARDSDGNLRPADSVYRMWLDREQTRRLREGKYFATLLRREDTCWERGFLDGSPLFFMDNADPRPDGPRGGSFYNKAPRFGVFSGEAITCEPEK